MHSFAASPMVCQLPVPSASLDRLTAAERLVAVHVAQGLSNKEIASLLSRAEPTVKNHVASALRKFRVQSRCQLIVRLLRR